MMPGVPWEKVNNDASRIEVPGGWIYRIRTQGVSQLAAVFVPKEYVDKCHCEWCVEKRGKNESKSDKQGASSDSKGVEKRVPTSTKDRVDVRTPAE